ncbi:MULTISPECIES: ribbon-helix-helix domain-containing protein [Rhizobium]|jgi:metal-responsive CopG/Arc/MetJ family transcriptional regulator|uniref:ribbon-helix-helix domain-containing protein n=1 Tax=Rhizobium TaxID=379 RepID=UPI001441E3A7|nr:MULTISPECIES: ribbon-helix-helix domain-containing protein [Rhizobium]MBY3231906.1 hypothetical protein [Rhizobium laguerreae]NKL08321.1 hypothetical protein [Rhizobium leguminosarum bv. viciae]
MGIQDITPAKKYRVKKESNGEKQVLLWMEGRLTEQLDRLIKSGAYRNRSEAVTDAVHRLIEDRN